MDHVRANIHCTVVNERCGRWVETVPTMLAELNKGMQPTWYPTRLTHGIAMTSNVKSWRKNSHDIFGMVRSSWRGGPSEAPEPVRSDG
jgi:hypothetical protein